MDGYIPKKPVGYKFPEFKQKKLISQYLQIEKDIENTQDESKLNLLKSKKKKIEDELYYIFYDLQTIIIGKKVMSTYNVSSSNPSIMIDRDDDVFQDLVIHSIQQMFQYFDKIDLDRKLYSILCSIQNYSSRIHYFTFYSSKNTVIVDGTFGDEESDFDNRFDQIYFDNNKHLYEEDHDQMIDRQVEEFISERFGEDEELEIDIELKNEQWIQNFDIFKTIDFVLKFGFCKEFKGIYIKLHLINLLVYEQMKKFNKNMFLFEKFIQEKKKYNKKDFNFKNGLIKIIKFIMREYTLNDPSIMVGDKQIKLYTILLLYILLIKKQIPQNNFSKEEIELMQNMKHQLSDMSELMIEKETEQQIDFNNLIFNCEFGLSKNSKTEIRLEMIIDGQEKKGSN